MLDTIRAEDFQPLVGQSLPVESRGTSAKLEVKDVRASSLQSPRAAPPFRVTLRSREGWRAAQGTMTLDHPTLGRLDLFVVPIGPDEIGPCYEIIFN